MFDLRCDRRYSATICLFNVHVISRRQCVIYTLSCADTRILYNLIGTNRSVGPVSFNRKHRIYTAYVHRHWQLPSIEKIHNQNCIMCVRRGFRVAHVAHISPSPAFSIFYFAKQIPHSIQTHTNTHATNGKSADF